MLIGAEADTGDVISGVLETVQPILEYLGTIAFAITGALVAGRKRMDISGVVVLGAIVSVGGGTVRDLLIQRPVFWVTDPAFLAVGAAAALLSVPVFRFASNEIRQVYWLVQSFDAVGLALFVVAGTNIALDAGANNVAAATIGIVSGIGGGVIRDLLANEIPEVLIGGRLYITAALVGSVVYIGLIELDVPAVLALWVPIVLIVALRFVSLRFGIGVPTIEIDPNHDPTATRTTPRDDPADTGG